MSLVYGKDNTEGIVSIEVTDNVATLFIEKNGQLTTEFRPNKYWMLARKPLSKGWTRLKGEQYYQYGIQFDKTSDFYSAKKRWYNEIYSISDPKESLMVKDGLTYYKGLKHGDVSCLSFDIETTGLSHDKSSKVLLISNTFRKNNQISRKLFAYDEYADEGKMLIAWCQWVREVNPSIILGHNIYSFDFPYLQYIADKFNVQLELGRDNSPVYFFKRESLKRVDGSRDQAYRKVRIYGREIIDTMFLAMNYDIGKKYESYALKKIIEQEGLEQKDRQFYDASQIRNNYLIPEEWAKIKEYCKHDANDSLAVFDLMGASFFYLNQSVPKSFQSIIESASGSQINSMMIRSYLQNGYGLPKDSPVYNFEGAISFGNPGIWKNCFKKDVASLYPSIMIEHEVYNKEKDPFGHMRELVKTFTKERLKNKALAESTNNKYYDDLQNSQKLIINSFFGFLAAPGLLFNSPGDAKFITETGREILQKASEWATGHRLKKVVKKTKKDGTQTMEWVIGDKTSDKDCVLVNADTDSIMFAYNDSRDMSAEHRTELLSKLNNEYPSTIRFADDGYFTTAIVLKAKNYVLHGWNNKKQKMETKIKGSALKDAKAEKALKEFMKDVIQTIISGENKYVDIYHSYIKEASNIQDISRWASKKTISTKILTSTRTNESKVRDAIEGEEIVEGDKVWCYFDTDKNLKLVDKFNGDYNVDVMYEKLFKKTLIFASVIPKGIFLNYKLKRNKKKLEAL